MTRGLRVVELPVLELSPVPVPVLDAVPEPLLPPVEVWLTPEPESGAVLEPLLTGPVGTRMTPPLPPDGGVDGAGVVGPGGTTTGVPGLVPVWPLGPIAETVPRAS